MVHLPLLALQSNSVVWGCVDCTTVSCKCSCYYWEAVGLSSHSERKCRIQYMDCYRERNEVNLLSLCMYDVFPV